MRHRRPSLVAIAMCLAAGCSDAEPPAHPSSTQSGSQSSAPTLKVSGAASSAARTGAALGEEGGGTIAAPSAAQRVPQGSARAGGEPASVGEATAPPPSERLASTPESRKAREDTVLADAERLLAAPRFGDFRSAAARYIEIVREMRPLDLKFAEGTIGESERETYWKLNERKTAAWARVHEVMFEEGFSREDRRAMGQWVSIRSTRDE